MTRMTRMARNVARVARWLADLVDPCLLVTLLEILLDLNSLPSDFSSPFLAPGCSRGKNFQLTLLLSVH